jgi:hypothetical protein
MYQTFGKIDDKRDFFIKQAVTIGNHKNFNILKSEFQKLSQKTFPFLKKTDFIYALFNILDCSSLTDTSRKAVRVPIG